MKVELPDAFAGQQLLVSEHGRDITREATYASTNPAIAKVDSKGYVTPTGDGSAMIRITRGVRPARNPGDRERVSAAAGAASTSGPRSCRC